MKKILTITLLVLLTVGLFVSCDADAIKGLFLEENPPVATSYTVTFDLNGITGTAPEAQTIICGAKVENPKNPTAAGLIFKGWYKEEACTNEWNFDTDIVTENTTLYAKWAKTVGYVIGDSFPKQDNAWTNGENCICYYDPWGHALVSALCFFKTSMSHDIFMYLNNEIAEAENGYIYRNGSDRYTVTFNMNGNNLQSIVFEAGSDAEESVQAVSGTYTPPSPTPTT